MALRILLADESPSIRKAFELALQDYGVKIQIVHQGVDVKELSTSFSPDICFMDILLPKLNGYEACTELKADTSLKDIPVVLMWSGFMELDKEKYDSSQADGNIEKPFETDTLRTLVKKLVPRLSSNELSDHISLDQNLIDTENDSGNNSIDEYSTDVPNLKADILDLPDLPSFGDFESEGDDTDVSNLDISPLGSSPQTGSPDIPAIPDFDEMLKDSDMEELGSNPGINEDFLAPEGLNFNLSDSDDEDWEEQPVQDSLAPEGLDDVDAFSVKSLSGQQPLTEENLPFETPDEFAEDDDIFAIPDSLKEGLSNLNNTLDDEEPNSDLPPTPDQVLSPEDSPKESAATSEPQNLHPQDIAPLKTEEQPDVPPLKNNEEVPVTAQVPPQLSKEELKRLILAQSKDIIESVVWDVVPELAKEMIQKEIQRLTGEVKFNGDLR